MNLFRFCSGLRVLGYLMILLVAAVVVVSYYAVVVFTWWPIFLRRGHPSLLSALAFFILLLFHLLLIMLLWSYFTVVFTDPGSVPENLGVELTGENLEAGVGISTDRRAPGSLGYCVKCRNVKPPRCHHCSVCQRCVLKMDHHCVWIVNCVGARNYKFFLLFLFYTFLETVLDTIVLLPSFIEFFSQAIMHSASPGKIAVLFLAFVLNLAFALSLLCFVVMHISLLSSNTTSVEVHEKTGDDRWKYDLGKKKNFEQVFGKSKALWLLPLYSKEDAESITALRGVNFPTRSDIDA
ncbi:PREDICTED: probable protein S-acyltransferase 12 [Tarenaya hassleriana]|uniref:probable protein S-acyltransferase 12 n=1 Tax=Tarenaya hassleriana TaxID=28532 RepID=UPI00053C13B3|nr:PREDICTED: probable protein S-acyltransferase 12 [Tarenaya hassleriana]